MWFTCRQCDWLDERTTEHITDRIRISETMMMPWWPSTVTVLLQTHTCEWTIGAPSRKPAAMRTVALSILIPTLDNGRASSQSPDPGERAANRRSRLAWSTAVSSNMSASTLQHESSQQRWVIEIGVGTSLLLLVLLLVYPYYNRIIILLNSIIILYFVTQLGQAFD